MSSSRFSSGFYTVIVIAIVLGVALYFRIGLPHDQIFSGDWIKFSGVDAYYHMRLVDNLLTHFPQRIAFDPFTFYPYGNVVGWPPFFDLMLGGIIWIVALGSPSEHIIDVIGVYFPAIMGSLTVLPVYFIGREVFNRWAGIIAAGLVAILPGEFLHRSLLGFTDHHVGEVFFSTVTILFLILALKSAKQTPLTMEYLKYGRWKTIRKPVIYSLLSGIFLGIYLLVWIGGLLFIFLIFAYFIVQYIIDNIRGESPGYIVMVSMPCLLFAMIITLPLLPEIPWLTPLYLPSFVIALIIPTGLVVISHLPAFGKIKRGFYPLFFIGACMSGLAIFYVINPLLIRTMMTTFSFITPAGSAQTIAETRPLFFPINSFTLSVAWDNFTTSFFLGLIALGILIYVSIKERSVSKTLVVVWSLIILAATLGQRRFGYYLTVNAALLTGYFSWQIIYLAKSKEINIPILNRMNPMKKGKVAEGKSVQVSGLFTSGVRVILSVLIVFFLVFFPNIGPAIDIAGHAYFAPDDTWCEALSWLKENTPEPFEKPDFYYDVYEPLPFGASYKYPETAYGVLAWWDYGHWITRIAHRIPVSNPFQNGISSVASFFLATDEASAREIVDDLGVRYIIADEDVATDIFHAISIVADKDHRDFFDVYYTQRDGGVVSIVLFNPEYYRSMGVRLFNFEGKAFTPKHCAVVSYEERASPSGTIFKIITDLQPFPTCEGAQDYISKQTSGNHQIVGNDPFVSPVPLDALEHYRLIYDTKTQAGQQDPNNSTVIKIFEYNK
ncbi:oligosaccharyl transferase, archaeosortase A system-associated [Chloroflexota bacterium]